MLTILGGFLFSLALLKVWGYLVCRLGAKGGFVAAALLIGLFWFLNHGSPAPLVRQSGIVFVDMGLAAGVGSIAYGLVAKGYSRSHLNLIVVAVCGGVVAGSLLFLLS